MGSFRVFLWMQWVAIPATFLPEFRMYWNIEEDGIFPTMNFGVKRRNRFEDILKYLQLSHASDPTEQLLEFLHAINNNLKEAMTPGDIIFRWVYAEKIVSHKSKG